MISRIKSLEEYFICIHHLYIDSALMRQGEAGSCLVQSAFLRPQVTTDRCKNNPKEKMPSITPSLSAQSKKDRPRNCRRRDTEAGVVCSMTMCSNEHITKPTMRSFHGRFRVRCFLVSTECLPSQLSTLFILWPTPASHYASGSSRTHWD